MDSFFFQRFSRRWVSVQASFIDDVSPRFEQRHG
jgi:hypothetical protein